VFLNRARNLWVFILSLILISFFIFICSAVSAGIIFSLNELSISQKKYVNDSLVKYQKDINKETIEEIKSLDNRLGVINSLIERHIVASIIFAELSKNTIRQVSFSSFDLKRKSDNTFSLVLKAQGIGYESIVAQDAQFSTVLAQKFFKNTSITDFSKCKGQILTSFGIDTSVSNNVINFSKIINNIPN
jgi:hypothetical protein